MNSRGKGKRAFLAALGVCLALAVPGCGTEGADGTGDASPVIQGEPEKQGESEAQGKSESSGTASAAENDENMSSGAVL